MKVIQCIAISLLASCSASETSSSRGKYAGADAVAGINSGATVPGEENTSSTGNSDGDKDGESGGGQETAKEPELTVDDLHLFFADDMKGAVDTELAEISSDDLKVAVDEDLGDNGLVEKLIPTYLTYADLDGSGDLNFTEFLSASIIKDGQESVVKAIVQDDKQTVFSFIDFGRDGALDTTDLLRLVKVRVWQLRAWKKDVASGDPDRLKLLVKTGYSDLMALVGTTYNKGILSTANFNKLVEGINAKLK